MEYVKLIMSILSFGLIISIVIALFKTEELNRNIKATSKALKENIDRINKQLDEIEGKNND